jgi:hypothetical protein
MTSQASPRRKKLTTTMLVTQHVIAGDIEGEVENG